MADALYLLDSNICIYVLKDAASHATARLERLEPGTAAASAVTYAEVMLGIPWHAGAARAAAERFFGIVPVLAFDQAAARVYADVPFRRGRFDRLIAAHALALGLTLVTNNEADFADVPDLRIENWATPL